MHDKSTSKRATRVAAVFMLACFSQSAWSSPEDSPLAIFFQSNSDSARSPEVTTKRLSSIVRHRHKIPTTEEAGAAYILLSRVGFREDAWATLVQWVKTFRKFKYSKEIPQEILVDQIFRLVKHRKCWECLPRAWNDIAWDGAPAEVFAGESFDLLWKNPDQGWFLLKKGGVSTYAELVRNRKSQLGALLSELDQDELTDLRGKASAARPSMHQHDIVNLLDDLLIRAKSSARLSCRLFKIHPQ